MKFVTVSELRLRATDIVREIEETREEVIVNKKGETSSIDPFYYGQGFLASRK
jgi:hypothetical protein